MNLELEKFNESLTSLIAILIQGSLYIFNTGYHNALLLSFEGEVLATLFEDGVNSYNSVIAEAEKTIIEAIGKSNIPKLCGEVVNWVRIDLMRESRARYLALITDPAWKIIVKEDTTKLINEFMTEETIAEKFGAIALEKGCKSDIIVAIVNLTKL